jgi:hypothetical protein
LISEPVLHWLLEGYRGGEIETQISYLTRGLSWHVEYIALLSEDEQQIEFGGWVSLQNSSGKTYPAARLNLLAGDINLVRQKQTPMRRESAAVLSMDAQSKQGFKEKEFFEYHLYQLPRAVTIKDKQTRQIQLFSTTTVQVTRQYIYNHRIDPGKVLVILATKNSEAQGLGFPVPRGKIRIYKPEASFRVFIGEDIIDHTARDEEIQINVGRAFDIAAKRTITRREKLGRNGERLYLETELRNHKNDAVEIRVTEPVLSYRSYEVIAPNVPISEKDSRKFSFLVTVPANSDFTLQYQLQYTW